MKAIITLLLLLCFTSLKADYLCKIERDTIKFENTELRSYYLNRYKRIHDINGLTQIRVPTHQLLTEGKYAWIEADAPKLKAAGLKGMFIKFRINEGAVELIHVPLRYLYFNFNLDTILIVHPGIEPTPETDSTFAKVPFDPVTGKSPTTESMGTINQWEAVRQKIRALIYRSIGIIYD